MAMRRRPWLAGVLNLLGAQGLGQLYNGTPRKALAFMLGLPVAAVLLAWTMTWAPGRPLNIVVPLATLLGLLAWCVIDAARDARRLADQPHPWHSRWYTCLGVWALNVFVLVPVLTDGLRAVVQAFKVQAGGMEQTILSGDRVLADKSVFGLRLPFLGQKAFGGRPPRRGDLALFRSPQAPEILFLKRVIGLPGETVEIRDRTVLIDGQPLSEPYAAFSRFADEEREGWGPLAVPDGTVFVLGDNRDNSRDSRFFGFVPVADVVGAASVVYYSHDDREGRDNRVRWERVGLRLR